MPGKEREGTSPRPWRNSLRATPTLAGCSSSIRPLLFDICMCVYEITAYEFNGQMRRAILLRFVLYANCTHPQLACDVCLMT